MSAFDRLQGYSAKRGLNETSEVFDVTTPAGAFLNRVHNEGYKMYEYRYVLKPEFQVPEGDVANFMTDEEVEVYEKSLNISESEYEKVENKEQYERVVEYTETHDAITTAGNQIINAVAGSGKALKNGTGVLTPDGFVPIESLSIGDLVASDDGNFYPVTGVFPQGLKDAYKLTFSDGNEIICSGDHLWNVQTDSQRTMEYRGSDGYFWDTKTVTEILATHPLRTRSGKNNCYIPMQGVVDFGKSFDLPLNSYILGLLLGNGTLSLENSIMFSTADSSVLENLNDILLLDFPDIETVHSSGYDYRLASRSSSTTNELKLVLKDLGLLGTHSDTKFIPESYLYSSPEDRFELLTGLLDTDGYWASSYYEYCTVSKRLAHDITFLCESLGLTVSVHEKKTSYVNKVTGERIKCKLCYRLNIKPSINHQKLHSCDRINVQFRETQGYCRRQIRDITNLDCKYEMTCISVASPNHLFLTEHFIPTHNTTALTFKIMYDIVTGEAMTIKQIESGLPVRVVNKMWVCTFLRSGAEELQSSLTKWQRKLGYSQTADQINFSTMDAEFKRCINAMGVATNIGDAGKLHNLFCKAVDSCNVSRSGGYPLTKEDYQILSGILVYYRGRLDNQRYNHPSMKDYDLTPIILDLIAKQFANLRATNGIMDFEEIMELLYKYLYVEPNPAVQDFVANRYNYIYIDEFQDTSQMAYAILKFYARGKLWLNRFGGDVKVVSEGGTVPDGLYTNQETLGKIVVVGDPSQCIYSFRGSDSKILVNDFDEDFKPCLSRLSVNWRCPANILNPVVSSIHCNPDSAVQDIKAAREGGEFFAYAFPSYKSMITQLKVDMTKDMEDGMRVAVLCRTNFDGLIPAFVLAEDGRFDFSISGENMTLSSPLPRKIIGVTSLFTERSTPAVKTTLEFFASRQDKWGVKQLIDTLKMNNMSIWQIPIEDIRYSCPSLEKFVTSVKKVFYTNGTRDKSKELEALRTVYYMMIVDVFAGDSAYCESARAYIETMLYVIENHDFQSVYEFLEEIELLNDKLAGRIKKKSAHIQIATVHEYKGKECDSVYVWNDSDGTFPSSKCDVNNEDQLNEERRVHYIACTRAKKREHIYSIQIKKGRFAKEMTCDWYNPVNPSAKLSKTANDLIL